MADKNENRQRLIRERVMALAVMHLTRRPDLKVSEVDEDIGLDLRVRIQRPEGGLREFGVELRGAWSRVTREHANSVLGVAVRQAQRYGPFVFPVCMFFFTMEETQGWYTWVAEPVISEAGKARLKYHQEASCEPLDHRALDVIVEKVNRWYDASHHSEVVMTG
jgi:hypothetical protein